MSKSKKKVVEVILDEKEPVKAEKKEIEALKKAYTAQNPVKAKMKAERGWLELK